MDASSLSGQLAKHIRNLRPSGIALESLEQRLHFLRNFLEEQLGNGTPHPDTAQAALEQKLAQFIRLLDSAELCWPAWVALSYLGLLARYPSVEELRSAQFSLIKDGFPSLLQQLSRSAELKKLLRRRCAFELVRAEPNTLYVDVTHTAYYALNSGIQRVVRSLCQSFRQANYNFQLFKIDQKHKSNRAILLEEKEQIRLFEWERYSILKDKDTSQLSLRHRIYFRLVQIYKCHPLFKSLALEKGWLKSLLKRFSALFVADLEAAQTHYRVPLFYDAQILLPEMNCHPVFPRLYEGLKSALPNSLTSIIYDLIPIFGPEYCTVSDTFLHYLRHLRCVDRVSCISQDVAQQLSGFAGSLYRHTPLKIEAHLLSGFVRRSEDQQQSPENPSEPPMVLSVSTIEPRKNHLSILRAALVLWEWGLKFRLVFAGSTGWYSQDFFQELHHYQAAGYPIEYLDHISDQQLANTYQQAHFTVFVSFMEGFGLPVLESLSFGKPCITSRRGSMLEIVQKAGGGCLTVDPENLEELIQAMQALLTDPALHQQLSKEAEALQWPSWETYAQEIFAYACQ